MPVGMAWKTFPMSERQMSHGSFSENLCLGLSGGLGDFALHGTRRPLRDFQHIAGYLNWALNVYPYLHPGLCVLYAKRAGKSCSRKCSYALAKEASVIRQRPVT